MRKLLIVPAILAMTSMSGGAFAQVRAINGGTQANGSGTFAIGSPTIGVNVALHLKFQC